MSTASWQDVDAHHTTEAISRAERPAGYVARQPLLDKPTDSHPILSQLMDEALCRIILTSDGAAVALRARTTGTRERSQAPSSDLAAIVDELDKRFEGCRTHRARLVVIKDAQETADRLRYSPKSEILIRGTVEWRQALANDPRPRRVVAADYRVSSKTITACRKEFAVSDLQSV